MTEIERDGAPVAAIVHDPSLLEDRELVRTAGAAAALALENERLDAELRARYDELRAAQRPAGRRRRRRAPPDRARPARRRAAAPRLAVADAATSRASSAEPGSQTGGLLDSAMAELTAGLAELRELARGIHPAVLTERGLEPALTGLAARAPLPVTISGDAGGRLPPAVEAAAYFVVDEALTNVAKYARATAARSRVEQRRRPRRGRRARRRRRRRRPGRRAAAWPGLADRVAALGGRLVVDEPARRRDRRAGRVPRTTVGGRYLIDVNVRSQDALASLITPLTSVDWSIGCLSHSHGMPAAVLGDHLVDLAPRLVALGRAR